MKPDDHTNDDPGFGRGFLGPRGESHRDNSTGVRSSRAGLADLTFHREGGPATAASCPAKDPRPALTFEQAAARRGHDTTTAAGAESARHDHRVWDLVDGAR